MPTPTFFKSPLQWLTHHSCQGQWPQRLGSDYCHKFFGNIYIGLLILAITMAAHSMPLFTFIEDTVIDWVIQMQYGTRTMLKNPDVPHFVFLDIDERTYQAWGEPFITPRDKLLQLLNFAVQRQPQIIIVDIDLSYPINRDSPTLHPHDQALKDYLASYETTQCASSDACPHLILLRSSRPRLEDEEGQHSPPREPIRILRPSFLDGVVTGQTPHLHWASALFELDEHRQLRRWRLCETAVNQQSLFVTIPAIQLLTSKLLNKENNSDWLASLKGKCEEAPDADSLKKRILYSIKYQPYQLYPQTKTRQGILTTVPALQFFNEPTCQMEALNQPSKPECQIDALQNSITVIGGSHLNTGDWHATPLGSMPGAVILMNAIASLQQHGEFEKPHKVIIVLIEICLIILISLISAYVRFYGMLIATGLIIFVMMPISFWLSKDGIWLDFAIPLLSIQLHRLAEKLEQH